MPENNNHISIEIPESFFMQESLEIRKKYMEDVNETSIVTLDFAKTQYLDSSGLGLMFMIIDRIKKNPEQLIAKNINSSVLRLLELAFIDKFLTIRK